MITSLIIIQKYKIAEVKIIVTGKNKKAPYLRGLYLN